MIATNTNGIVLLLCFTLGNFFSNLWEVVNSSEIINGCSHLVMDK